MRLRGFVAAVFGAALIAPVVQVGAASALQAAVLGVRSGPFIAGTPVPSVSPTGGAPTPDLLTTAGTSTTSTAGTSAPGTSTPGVAPAPDALTGGGLLAKELTSKNWSGYAVQSAGKFTAVSGSWTQPAVTCGQKATYVAFWVGIDGYGDPTVEQLGTEATCYDHHAQYGAWYEMYPKQSVTLSNRVEPGDVIDAQVVRTGKSYKLSITDVTQGWSRSFTKRSTVAEAATAEWIAEAPCCTEAGATLPLATYGKVNFTAADAAAGAGMEPISAFGTDRGPHEISMTKKGAVISQPSTLTASGTAFSVATKPS